MSPACHGRVVDRQCRPDLSLVVISSAWPVRTTLHASAVSASTPSASRATGRLRQRGGHLGARRRAEDNGSMVDGKVDREDAGLVVHADRQSADASRAEQRPARVFRQVPDRRFRFSHGSRTRSIAATGTSFTAALTPSAAWTCQQGARLGASDGPTPLAERKPSGPILFGFSSGKAPRGACRPTRERRERWAMAIGCRAVDPLSTVERPGRTVERPSSASATTGTSVPGPGPAGCPADGCASAARIGRASCRSGGSTAGTGPRADRSSTDRGGVGADSHVGQLVVRTSAGRRGGRVC